MSKQHNSVEQVVEFLNTNPLSTESDIQIKLWGYNRHTSYESNKKYAELLRRGLAKGLYTRVRLPIKGIQSRYFYYVPR